MTTLTNEEILEAAKEAGLYMTSPERIAAVERLVAIIERKTIEKCAVVCDSINSERFDKAHHLNIQEDVDFVHGESAGAEECAAAIRKLGDE